LAALQTLHWHLSAPFKDIIEQTVERFDGLGAPLVEKASNLHAAIAMRIRSPSGGHQFPIVPGAFGAQRRAVNRDPPALLFPGLQDPNQITPESADQVRQVRRQSLQAPLSGAPAGESALFASQTAQWASHGIRRLEKR
jgi:hypothetical protein